jgi:hypothetical protein
MGMAVNSLQKQPAKGPGQPFEKGRSVGLELVDREQ